MRDYFYKALPEDEGIDRIELAVVPRYKTSGLSGDEWRISVAVRFFRKGQLLWEKSFNRMEYAIAFLGAEFHSRPENSPIALWGFDDDMCMQPSCSNQAEVEYRLKEEYSARGEGPLPKGYNEKRRRFCSRHSTRGDCGLEDADRNYEVISGEKKTPQPKDEAPAAQITAPVSNLEELPKAIRKAHSELKWD